MSKKLTLQIRLSKKILEEIDKIVEKGYYTSRSEYIQEQVRKDILKRKNSSK